MNITFLVGHLAKERHSLLFELITDLGKKNNVTVITGFPSRRITEETRQYYLNNEIEQITKKIKVIRVGSRRGEGKSLLTRMINYIFLTLSIYKESKKYSTDVFYIYSTPPFLGLLGGKLKRIAPTLYNAQDLFPDSLVQIKGYSESNILIKFLRKLEKKVYRDNSKIITISEDMKETIIKKAGDPKKISVIKNWVDTEQITKIERKDNPLFDKFELDKSNFYISYAGDIGLFQNWEIILDSAEMLDKDYSDIKFVIIGNGSYREELQKSIKTRGLKNVYLFPLQPIEMISCAYSFGDLELVSLKRGMTSIALPSKVGQILSAGSPILAMFDNNSFITKEITDKKLGSVVKDFSSKSLTNIITSYYKNKSQLKVISNNCRNYAIEKLDRKKQTAEYDCYLKEISVT